MKAKRVRVRPTKMWAVCDDNGKLTDDVLHDKERWGEPPSSDSGEHLRPVMVIDARDYKPAKKARNR